MYKWILFLAATAAWAGDAAVALALKAQTDFDRVELAPLPRLEDTMRCTQSQAEALPVARPADLPVAYYRKGYCELLEGDNRAAAGDLARALGAWPNRGTEPVSAGLQVLSAVARLRAGVDAGELDGIRAGLAEAENSSVCLSTIMSPGRCRELVDLGRLWLGWLAARDHRDGEASRYFAAFPQTAWPAWIGARQALEARRYADAAGLLRQAVEMWRRQERFPQAGILAMLGPASELRDAIFLLARTEFLAGQYKAALGDFEAAIKADPGNAQALYLRGRTREALGEGEGALTDYQLASRLAFAHPDRPEATALAHYYRGVWQYRRKSWAQAEDEFASALNSAGDPALRADISAWRYLAAVAGGACQASVASLEQAAGSASDLFPREEARQRLRSCAAECATVQGTYGLPQRQ